MQDLPINWKTQFVIVTPQDATRILEKNDGNRKLRNGVVEKYMAVIAAENWRLSPQPIIIADTGRVLDGQHRLVAVERSGKALPFTIISGVPEEVFQVLDRGSPRSTADALNLDKRLVEVSKVILGVGLSGSRITDHEVAILSAVLAEDFSDLISACGTAVRFFSSAPIRAAAVVRLLGGYDRDFVIGTYRSLVLGEMQSLRPAAQSLVSAVASGRLKNAGTGAGPRADMLARAWDVFDPRKAEISKLSIRDPKKRIDEIKRIVSAATSQAVAAIP